LLSDKEIQLKDGRTIKNTIIKVCKPDEFSKIEVIRKAILITIIEIKDNDKKVFGKQ
jgi:hypothetical protein